MPPKVIGPYRVLETLGSGGVGTVYRAVDRRTGEHIALKLLSTGPALDPRAARRLAREFEALADFSHPNVVKVFDTGVFQGYPYLTMELVEGLTLRNYLDLTPLPERQDRSASSDSARTPNVLLSSDDDDDEETTDHAPTPFTLDAFAQENPSEADFESGPESVRALADMADEPDTINSMSDYVFPPDFNAADPGAPKKVHTIDYEALNSPERISRLKDSMLQLCEALSYIHGHGLIHRDLKPSNIMVDQEQVVRLMDFGLAKFIADDAALTADGRLVGTFRYMSPEQIMGEPVDPRADLYSLGVILYELLGGKAPFDAKTPYELWQKVLETEAPAISSLNPAADPQMGRVAHRLIRKEPGERFQTAEEVFEALSE